jgi:hypothetical protein
VTSTILSSSDPHHDPLYHRLIREVEAVGLATAPADPTPVTEAEVTGLPPVVRRYLRFMEVVGRPRVRSLSARFAGRFRLRPRLGWMPAQAWQYNANGDIARVFVMRVRLAGVVPMVGRDTYLRGHGHTLGRLLEAIGAVIDAVIDAVLIAAATLTPHALGLRTDVNRQTGGELMTNDTAAHRRRGHTVRSSR